MFIVAAVHTVFPAYGLRPPAPTMIQAPFVSVVMRVYNAARFVAEARALVRAHLP